MTHGLTDLVVYAASAARRERSIARPDERWITLCAIDRPAVVGETPSAIDRPIGDRLRDPIATAAIDRRSTLVVTGW